MFCKQYHSPIYGAGVETENDLIKGISNNSKFKLSKSLNYSPIYGENSVVKYNPDDEIKLKQEDFVKLFKTFFAEIESKYL